MVVARLGDRHSTPDWQMLSKVLPGHAINHTNRDLSLSAVWPMRRRRVLTTYLEEYMGDFLFAPASNLFMQRRFLRISVSIYIHIESIYIYIDTYLCKDIYIGNHRYVFICLYIYTHSCVCIYMYLCPSSRGYMLKACAVLVKP